MTENRLVRHPTPKATESLQGYLLRLAEANGYTTARPILKLAGISTNESKWKIPELAKLAAITGSSIEAFEKIAYKRASDDFSIYRILGHEVLLRDLWLGSSRVCPQCIDELGFIEAVWNLDLFVGCPIHKQTAIWFCPHCKDRVPVRRKGMLTCRCGTSFRNHPTWSLSSEAAYLLDLIRYKLVGERKAPETGFTAIEMDLLNLPLKQMICNIRSLGFYRSNASWIRRRVPGAARGVTPDFGRGLLHSAANVLGNWPHGYQQLITDCNPRMYKPSCVVIPTSFDEMLHAISAAKGSRYERSVETQSECSVVDSTTLQQG